MNNAEKKAIRVIVDLIYGSDDFEVEYDWYEILEVRFNDGQWVKITLEAIADPTPKELKENGQ